MPERLGRQLPRAGVVWAGAAGVVFAVVGFLASLALLQNPALRLFAFYSGLFPYAVAVASLLVGGACWWLVVEWPRQRTRVRGAIVGLATGIVVHPVTWTLVFAYDAAKAGSNPLQSGLLAAALLFSFFSLGVTGVVTVSVGAVAGVAVALARERTVTWEQDSQQSPRVVVGSALLTGVVTVVLLLLVGFVLPVVAAISFATAVVTTVALRWLPAVRRSLVRAYSRSGERVTASLADRSFVARHALACLGGAVVYYLSAIGFVEFVGYLYSSVLYGVSPGFTRSLGYRLDEYAIRAYPVVFVGVSVVGALVASRRLCRGDSSESRRRVALEWSLFLAVAVGVYTGGFLVVAELGT